MRIGLGLDRPDGAGPMRALRSKRPLRSLALASPLLRLPEAALDRLSRVPTAAAWIPRRLWILALIALPILSVAVFYWTYTGGVARSQPSPTFQTMTVSRGSLVSTLPATGSTVSAHQAQLSFHTGGEIMELNAAVGDAVKAGQVLATLDAQNLAIRAAQAESALRVSQLKLEQLQQGTNSEEEAAARTAVEAAQARYQEATAGPAGAELQAAQSAVDHAKVAVMAAEARLGDLKRGPTNPEIAAVEAQVDGYRSSLASAEAKLRDLGAGALQEELGIALAALAAAQSKQASAEARLERLKASPSQAELASAQAEVDEARAALTSAEDRYHLAVSGDPRLGGGTSVAALQQASEAARSNLSAAEQRLALLMAGPAAQEILAAERELESARQTVNVAAARVEQLQQGPLPSDVAVAQQAVDAARASLIGAEAKLALLKEGPSEADVLSAESNLLLAKANLADAQAKLDLLQKGASTAQVESARSSLASAQAQLAAVMAGPSSTEVAIAEEQVTQAQIAVEEARLATQRSTLVAPFDGIVAAVTTNVGEQARDSVPIITLVDPEATRVEVMVEEGDVARLAPGQRATVNLGAHREQNLPGRVVAVSPLGTGQQRAATYSVSVDIDSPEHAIPLGMSASVNIETERKANVLLVPSSALRGQGISRTVQVMVDGKPQERVVQTGSSNGQFTEIVSGLSEDDVVVIRTSYSDTTG